MNRGKLPRLVETGRGRLNAVVVAEAKFISVAITSRVLIGDDRMVYIRDRSIDSLCDKHRSGSKIAK